MRLLIAGVSQTLLPALGTPFFLLGFLDRLDMNTFALSYSIFFVLFNCHVLEACSFWRGNTEAVGEREGLGELAGMEEGEGMVGMIVCGKDQFSVKNRVGCP